MASKDTTTAIQSYVTDMLALERHISKAFQAQIEDLEDYPTVVRELRTINATTESHIRSLENLADQLGGEGSSGIIKKVGSTLAGLAAGAIDLVRNESLPKNLRDDYTATSLATIGYVMLYTTSLSLGDRTTAELAHRHFVDYTEVVMTLHNVIPGAVIEFLQEEGLPARDEVLPEISQTLQNAWRQNARQVPEADEIPVDRSAGM
jgi:ferritin-like metal-binding protein YciE